MNGFLVLVPVSYLLGSVPFGLIAGWAVRRVDVRDYGSGNTGMTNVLRTVGRPAAVVVLALDMGKGILAVALAMILFDSHTLEAVAGLAVLAGHNWPVFLRFKGGKGTATGWGSLLMLSPLSGLAATLVGIPIVAVTRYVSLGSMVAGTVGNGTLVVLALIGRGPAEYVWFGAFGSALILLRHRDNIRRLVRGEEHKLGQAAGPARREPDAGRRKGLRWPKSA